MHSCGLNPICYVTDFLAPFWFWIQVGFWIVVALIVLWVLAKLREVGGWPAVVAALVAAAGGAGYVFGRKSVTVQHPARTKSTTLTPEQLMALQRALAQRNLYPGEIDGKFGQQSQAGMKAFQRSRNEPQTGLPTYDQLHDLGIAI